MKVLSADCEKGHFSYLGSANYPVAGKNAYINTYFTRKRGAS